MAAAQLENLRPMDVQIAMILTARVADALQPRSAKENDLGRNWRVEGKVEPCQPHVVQVTDRTS